MSELQMGKMKIFFFLIHAFLLFLVKSSLFHVTYSNSTGVN